MLATALLRVSITCNYYYYYYYYYYHIYYCYYYYYYYYYYFLFNLTFEIINYISMLNLLDITSKFRIVTILVTVVLEAELHAEFIGMFMFMIYLHA